MSVASRLMLVAFVLMIVIPGARAKADNHEEEIANFPFEPWCMRNYRAESFGLGIGAGYGYDTQLVPSKKDDFCYNAGHDVGAELAHQHGSSADCRTAFLQGMAQGLDSDPETVETPSECSIAGYSYGEARLANAIRHQDAHVAGADCLAEYQHGWDASKQHLAPTYPSTSVNRLNTCYMTGYDDATLW